MPPVFEHITITPTVIPAGDTDTLTLTLTLGAGYTRGESRIIFDMPATIGMSRPTLNHDEEPGFTRVYISNPRIAWKKAVWDIEGQRLVTPQTMSYRGMAARLFVLNLSPGLCAGDTVTLKFGETKNGYGVGWSAATVVPKTPYDAEIDIRYFANPEAGLPDLGRDIEGTPRPVPDHQERVTFRITPREPVTVRVIRQPHRCLVLPQDRFCNIADGPALEPLVECNTPLKRNALGTFETPMVDAAFSPGSVPLSNAPQMDKVFEDYSLYWGDIHTHSRYSNDCLEREKQQMTPGEIYAYARDRAGLDFYAVTDHHQPWDIERNKIGPEAWANTVAEAKAESRDAAFLGLVGFEFRAQRGDTAVVFRDFPTYAEINQPGWKTIRKLWEHLQGQAYLTIPHFHARGGLELDDWWIGPDEIEPALEIFSCHGSYEAHAVFEHEPALCKSRRPDRTARYLLDRGIRYGFCCNSDGHKGHAGQNGLTAVFAKELTREGIFEAYRARRIYGTTNARIRLVFTGNGALMGAEVANRERKLFHIEVMGENDLKKVELVGNGEIRELFVPDGKSFAIEHAVEDAAPGYWYVRVTQHDNHIAWSSPIWFS